MGRQPKKGLDYFSVDVQFSDSVKLIQAEFGLVGIGCIIKLWQKIYGDKGYYTKWDDDVALVFAQDCKTGANVVKEVVSACLRRGIFDREMFDRYGILTSEGIQERYASAVERRVLKKIDGRYLLIAMPSNWIYVDKNSIYVDGNAENVDKNTQSKVKQSKVKESKVKEREDAHAEDGKEIFGCFGNVRMSADDHERLVSMFGEKVAGELIDNLSRKLKSKGYKYEDHYATILIWAQKDGVKPITEASGSFDTNEFFELALARSYKNK